MEAERSKLYVGGIARETSEDVLQQHFSKYGDVSRAVVPKDREARTPRGFAFVWFSDPASAKAALEDEEHVILGKKVLVREANKTEQRPNQQAVRPGQNHSFRTCGNSFNGNSVTTRYRSRKIFVGGLPTSLTEDEFKNFFERFGKTTDVVIMLDLYGKPRGFGFVTFALEESVEDVMKNNFYELHGRYVEVKRAIPKEARSFCHGSCEVNGQMERQQGCGDYYWPVYYPTYPSPYESFDGYGPYGHYSSYHELGWVSYGATAYSVSRAVHFEGSGPTYVGNMFGYYKMPIPTNNGFMSNGFATSMSRSGCIEDAYYEPVFSEPEPPQIEKLKLTDCDEGEADTPAPPGIKDLKPGVGDGSESDCGNGDVTKQDDDH